MGDRGVSRLVSVLLSSASLSLSLPLSLTKQICRFIPLCSLQGGTEKEIDSNRGRHFNIIINTDKSQVSSMLALSAVIDSDQGQNSAVDTNNL